MPQDGQDKQEGEQAASTRWLRRQAAVLAPPPVPLRGDDRYSQPPCCALALAQGCNGIRVCTPASHAKRYERLAFWPAQDAMTACAQRRQTGRLPAGGRYRFINEVVLQEGSPALAAHGRELTVVHAKTGAQLYYNTFLTKHHLSAETVALVAQAGRGRWQGENEHHNVRKTKGYHGEHNFGHGTQYLSATMLSLNF
jgi:hypothetical protein